MSAQLNPRRWPVAAFALAALVAAGGCNPFTALYFLFLMPPPKVPAAYDGLQKKKVALVVHASRGAQFQHAGVDNDVARNVARELRENVKGIELCDIAEVREWRDEHEDFDLTDVGEKFQADRVVYLEIYEFTLFQEQSSQLYRGKTKIHVQVADMEKEGDIVFEEDVELEFPPSRPIPASDMSQQKFRGLFMRFLARKTAHLFFKYRPDEDFEVN
jgi:hypothetical protein